MSRMRSRWGSGWGTCVRVRSGCSRRAWADRWRGDFGAQARQVFANLAIVLGNAGTGLEHVVKVTIFVTDMAVIDRVVQLRREFFIPPYPADTIAQVVSLADPAWQIEIEAIAVVPEATMSSR
jgi:enamine deaminase RidA (YjgF/YER057c/UK114 family)